LVGWHSVTGHDMPTFRAISTPTICPSSRQKESLLMLRRTHRTMGTQTSHWAVFVDAQTLQVVMTTPVLCTAVVCQWNFAPLPCI
jgi:hypothetical protein